MLTEVLLPVGAFGAAGAVAIGHCGVPTAAVAACVSIGLARSKQIVAAGCTEIPRRGGQDRAHFIGLQRRIALQQQRGNPANEGGRKTRSRMSSDIFRPERAGRCRRRALQA